MSSNLGIEELEFQQLFVWTAFYTRPTDQPRYAVDCLLKQSKPNSPPYWLKFLFHFRDGMMRVTVKSE